MVPLGLDCVVKVLSQVAVWVYVRKGEGTKRCRLLTPLFGGIGGEFAGRD